MALVGTRNGWIEKWDTRTGTGPVASTFVAKEGGAITDMEASINLEKIAIACEKNVRISLWRPVDLLLISMWPGYYIVGA